MEATLTIDPLPRSRMRGSTARAHSHIERRSTAKNVSQSSTDIETGSKAAFTPALLTSTSTGPSWASIDANASAT